MNATQEITKALKLARSASAKLHHRRPAGMALPVSEYLLIDLDGAIARLEAACDRITWTTEKTRRDHEIRIVQAGGPR